MQIRCRGCPRDVGKLSILSAFVPLSAWRFFGIVAAPERKLQCCDCRPRALKRSSHLPDLVATRSTLVRGFSFVTCSFIADEMFSRPLNGADNRLPATGREACFVPLNLWNTVSTKSPNLPEHSRPCSVWCAVLLELLMWHRVSREADVSSETDCLIPQAKIGFRG